MVEFFYIRELWRERETIKKSKLFKDVRGTSSTSGMCLPCDVIIVGLDDAPRKGGTSGENRLEGNSKLERSQLHLNCTHYFLLKKHKK